MAISDETREKIAARIQKLLQVTRERGATEAEALAAAARAATLLASHNMSFTEVEVRSAEHVRTEEAYGTERSDNLLRVAEYIAKLTDTIAWSRGNAIGYFGTRIDCEMAQHLTRVVWDALENEAAMYVPADATGTPAPSAPEQTMSNLRASFQRGMADRLRDRITELNRERELQEGAATHGSTLVPLKKATVAAAFEKSGMRLNPYKREGVQIDFNAYLAGQTAAAAVVLQKPLEKDRHE